MMSSPQLVTHLVGHCLIAAVLLTSVARGTLGCSLADDIFQLSCLWTQSVNLESRYNIDLCQKTARVQHGSRMSFTPDGKSTHEMNQWHWDCLEAYSDKTFLVKKGNSVETFGYECIKFSPLTKRVVRLEKSSLVKDKKKLDCLSPSSTYTPEESVLVASHDLHPVTCPLAGGYQILMHLPDNIPNDRKCVDSASSYRPHVQFQCDRRGSSLVLADLGPSCVPGAVQESRPMRGRHRVQLHCVDTWHENAGTDRQSTSVLLRVQHSNLTLWCLHLRRVPHSAHSAVVSPEETLYDSFLTFDGRCLPEVRGSHSVPTDSAMFGKLASFIPSQDRKCIDTAYLYACEHHSVSKCAESTDCPDTCGRCLEQIAPPTGSIPETFHGTWESFSSGGDDNVRIYANGLKTSSYGNFRYRKTDGVDIFALVQVGEQPTCMPYYTCAKMSLVSPALLRYQLFPALRDGGTGHTLDCLKTETSYRRASLRTGAAVEKTSLLVQPEKLQETSCNIMATRRFELHKPGSNCRLVMHECSGQCQTFNVSLEAESCVNETAKGDDLFLQHTCLAVIQLSDMDALLTRTPDKDRYLCWVMISVGLILLEPEACNTDNVAQVLEHGPDKAPNLLEMLKQRWHSVTEEKNASSHTVPSILALALAVFNVLVTLFPRVNHFRAFDSISRRGML